MPMSIRMTPVMIPAWLFRRKSEAHEAEYPQPIKLKKLRIPTFYIFSYKDAVKAPAMHEPNADDILLDAWNGASPILNKTGPHGKE